MNTNKKIKVFISSPYTLGDKEENVKNSLEVADKLMSLGMPPFTPVLGHYQDIILPRDEEDWLAWDIEWMLMCDVVLRLPGKSVGADNEVKIAKENNMLVFYSIVELTNYVDLLKFNSIQTT
jgi:hypothetical protein